MADDDVDDYMTITFSEDAPAKETSLQRRRRIEREGRERGRIPSKAELARKAELEREAALNRSLFERSGESGQRTSATTVAAAPLMAGKKHAQPASKGLAMMARMGFVPGQALGRRRGEETSRGATENAASAVTTDDDRLREPIRINVKRGRGGIGAVSETNGQDTDDGRPVGDAKRAKTDNAIEVEPLAYRDRVRQERETARLERLVHAAQVVAEQMDEAAWDVNEDVTDTKAAVSAAVNVRWRGLVRSRRKAEHERKLRHKSRQMLDLSLSKRGRNDDELDADDRIALGQGPERSFLAVDENGVEDEEDEDEELATFEALAPKEQLRQITDWLRDMHRYCFWCKTAFPDAALNGCPGPTEEDHE